MANQNQGPDLVLVFRKELVMVRAKLTEAIGLLNNQEIDNAVTVMRTNIRHIDGLLQMLPVEDDAVNTSN